MSILPKLLAIYKEGGWETLTGYSPYHFGGSGDVPFTIFLNRTTKRLTGNHGLALQEIMFLEHFSSYLEPKRILVVGNAFGWSTLALALIFPQARVVGIDPMEDGNAVTNELASRHGLNAVAVKGESPGDVASICADHLNGPCDLVLIDAIHTSEAVVTDFEACLRCAHEGTVFVFHDAINWGLLDGFQNVCTAHHMSGQVLTRTPSGMAIAYRNIPADLRTYIEAFADDPGLYHQYREWVLKQQAGKPSAAPGKS
ncbi:MAG: class I SAM-dependent methyltransferase [Stellaceae bacterium]|jgi:predicted O-methyltransferase YrrM